MAIVSQTSSMDSILPRAPEGKVVSTTAKSKELGKDAFLKLLITQMKNQDPLKPMEGIEMTQQLAQFTSLEQLQNLNSQFTSMNSAIQSQNNYQVLNLVGKNVKAKGSSISVSGGVPTGGSFTLEAAATVQATIYGSSGELVRTINLGALKAGTHSLTWDGLTSKGTAAADGVYQVEFTTKGSDGKPVECSTQMQGKITGVTFNPDGTVSLSMSGIKINISDIQEVTVPTSQTNTSLNPQARLVQTLNSSLP